MAGVSKMSVGVWAERNGFDVDGHERLVSRVEALRARQTKFAAAHLDG